MYRIIATAKVGKSVRKKNASGMLCRPKAQIVLATLAVCALTGGFLFFSKSELGSPGLSQEAGDIVVLNQLLAASPEELQRVDIGLMNLLCAEDLKGSEDLNVSKFLATLDEWTNVVSVDTARRMAAYYRNPSKYDNSPNLFKAVTMILTLKNTIGVDYNMEIMQRDEFPDSKDVFLHGCLSGKKEGGCISIPVLCVAVGRRLGYPLKLVLTRQHVFFRWDDGKEVFNMEACCPGCDTHPDDYYRHWPKKLDESEITANHLLKSLTPSEELGLFLETRGHCLFDVGRLAEAQIMYAYAYKLMPAQVRLAHMDRAIRSELKKSR